MKALPKIPPLTGLDNFLGVARLACGAGALARESFWVAQRFQRCDSMYVTEHAISPLSFRTGFSREESAFPLPAIHASIPQLRNPNTTSPVQGRNNNSPARKCRVSHGSRARALRAPLPNPHIPPSFPRSLRKDGRWE